MAWNPEITVIDTGAIEANLVAYLKTNQAAALLWANGGAALKPFQFLSDKPANKDKPGFPVLMTTGGSEGVETGDDMQTFDFQIGFEVICAKTTGDAVVREAKKYARALKSLLFEIDKATITAGIEDVLVFAPDKRFTVRYDEVGANEQETMFFQRFQIDVVYRFYAANYSN